VTITIKIIWQGCEATVSLDEEVGNGGQNNTLYVYENSKMKPAIFCYTFWNFIAFKLILEFWKF
jgi:hypothetical protein